MWFGRHLRRVAACRRLLRHRPPLPLPSSSSSSSSPSLHFPRTECASSPVRSCAPHHVHPAVPSARLQRVGCSRSLISSCGNQSSCGQDDNKRQAKASADSAKPSMEGAKTSMEGAGQATSKKVQDLTRKEEGTSEKGFGSAVKAVFSMNRNDWVSKLHHWKTEGIITLKHYWVGIKLLWTDVRVSSRLLLKLSKGKSLSRRERQQLTRTTADMFRLVPFAIFIVVPFMELLLPVFLKVFPNMLPSTFQDKIKEEEAQQRRLSARMQYAKFLQDTVKELAKEIKTTRTGDIKRTAEDLDNFINKVRTGERVSNDDILGFAKLFNDEITLDNLSRAFTGSRKMKPEEAVQATLSSLPDEVIDSVGISELPSEGLLRERMRKLEFIKSQEEMIKKAEQSQDGHKVKEKKN